MDHQLLNRQPQDSSNYIISHIQLDLLPKVQPSSSLSSYNLEAFVDFSLTDLTLAYSASNNIWGFESSNEHPATYPTLGLIDLQSEVCNKGRMIWVALTELGLQETFFDQVVEDLRAKIVEVGFVKDDFVIHAQVHILRVSLEDDVPEAINFESEVEVEVEVEDDCVVDDISCDYESFTFEVEDDSVVDDICCALLDAEDEEEAIKYSEYLLCLSNKLAMSL